jgi:hypothetical protein
MIRLAKPAVVLGLASAVALAMATPSEARSGRNAAAIGAGVAGFAIGAAVGSAAANRGYYNEPYAYYGEPAYVDSYAYAPGPTYYSAPAPAYDSYAYSPAPAPRYYGGDPSGYYAPTYATPRYRYNYRSSREDHLTGTGAGFAD